MRELCQVDFTLDYGPLLEIDDDVSHSPAGAAAAIGAEPTPALLQLTVDAGDERAEADSNHEIHRFDIRCPGHDGPGYLRAACASTRVW